MDELIPALADPVLHDIEEAVGRISPQAIDALCDARLLITGGTGFLGSWLVDVLVAINRRYRLDLAITLLTRQKSALARRRPDWSAASGISLLQGDVRDFAFPTESITHVVHAATDVASANATPDELANSVINGSRHVLEVAKLLCAKRYIYLSSGAAAGQRTFAHPISEETPVMQSVSESNVYGEAKLFSERLHLDAIGDSGIGIVIARGFAFVGPRMPLGKFAIGNFIRDALANKPPRLNSTGKAVRSYLYAADAACWFIELLTRGASGDIYNVGSAQGESILEVAYRVARVLGSPMPKHGRDWTSDGESYYVPDTHKIRSALGLSESVLLDDAIRKTARWAINSGIRDCRFPGLIPAG